MTNTKTAAAAVKPAPYRFTFDMAEIVGSAYGNPIPTLTLTGPRGDARALRAAGLRAMADAEELLIGFSGCALRLEEGSGRVTITTEADSAKEAATIRDAFAMAGRIATGHAGWATRADGERVVVSVPR